MSKPVEPWMEKASDEIFRVRIKGAIPQIIANHCPVVTSVVTAMLQDKDARIAELEAAEPQVIVREIVQKCPECGRFPVEVRATALYLEQLPNMPTLEQLEQLVIAETLRRTNGHRLEAAAILGIGKTTLYRKLRDSEQDSTEAKADHQHEETAAV